MSMKLIFWSSGGTLPRSMARTFGGPPPSGGPGSYGMLLNFCTILPMSMKSTLSFGDHTFPQSEVVSGSGSE